MATDETSASDAELAAIASCLNVLRPLSEAARNRALAYLTERLAAETTSTNGENGK